MRPLIIDPSTRAQAARVVAYAHANHYHVGAPLPGDNPRYCLMVGTYRCVFTFTDHKDGITWRHLSISVPSAKYPHPAAAFMIAADLFGFTGWDRKTLAAPPDWAGRVNKREHCVVLGQRMPKGNA